MYTEMVGRVKLSYPEIQQARYNRQSIVVYLCYDLWDFMTSHLIYKQLIYEHLSQKCEARSGDRFPSQCPYWVYLCRDCTQVSGWLVLWMFQYFHCVTVGILIRKQETRSGLLSSTHRLPVTVQRVSGGFGVNRKTFIILVDFNFA